MGQTPKTFSWSRRFAPAILLILCLACLTVSASAATVGRSVPATTSPFQLQPSIALATPTPQTVACQAPCECLDPLAATAKWGASGFSQCAEHPCEYGMSVTGAPVEKYCFKQKATATVTIGRCVSFVPVTTTPALVHFVPGTVADSDGDKVLDPVDNCPSVSNPDQYDHDGDGIGDACDLCVSRTNTLCAGEADTSTCSDNMDGKYAEFEDMNDDLIGDLCDNCVTDYNPNQTDSDKDGRGDACDSCPYVATASQELPDRDGDGIADACDACPAIFDPGQQPSASGSANTPAAMNPLTACYGCYAPIVSPADDLDNNGVRDSCEPRVNLLFVPLN